MAKAKIELDLTKLEELARTGKTQKEIAEELGINFQTFKQKLKLDQEVNAVYRRGSSVAAANGTAPTRGGYKGRKTDNAAVSAPAPGCTPALKLAPSPKPPREPKAKTKPAVVQDLDEDNPEPKFTENYESVRAAIRAGCNFIRSIGEFAGIALREVQPTLWEMETKSLVESRQIGQVSAWFVEGEVPEGQLFLNGKGGVESRNLSEANCSHTFAETVRETVGAAPVEAVAETIKPLNLARCDVVATDELRLRLLKRIHVEILFYEAYGEFSPKRDGVLMEAMEVLR